MKLLWHITRNRYMVFFDVIFVAFSHILVTLLNQRGFLEEIVEHEPFLTIGLFLFPLVIFLFGGYRICWIYAGTRDYCRIIGACLTAGLVLVFLSFLDPTEVVGIENSSMRMNVVTSMIAFSLILGCRMGIRGIRRMIGILASSDYREDAKRVIVIGAGSLAVTLARDITINKDLNYEILGFVDDDKLKRRMLIQNAEVLGATEDIPTLCERLHPDELIFAISLIDPEEKKRILNICAETKCELKMVAGFAESLLNRRSTDFLRKVEVEDLLGREMVQLDNSVIAQDIQDKVVMVTGGGGSIGSELCRQIMRFMPKQLVVLDIYENNVFELENDLREKFPDGNISIVIASVRDEMRLMQVFEEYKPEIVFHAAAHKHVPMMEANATEAVKNNVFGTWNATQCASKTGVKKFVMISTDKAVNPTNIMGATKRICEMIIQSMQTISETEFVAVRFGNVLDSNGSVLPRFKKQLKKGGPLTVTHPDITRFFMTIPEAAQLVLQAAAFAKGGEIFVLDMGKPVRIYDLARNLIQLSGLRVGKDVEIVFTGLRPGEKLYEELLMNEEGLEKTAHNKIYVGQPIFDSVEELERKLKILEEAVESGDNDTVRTVVAQVVPTYQKPLYKPVEHSQGEAEPIAVKE